MLRYKANVNKVAIQRRWNKEGLQGLSRGQI